MAKLYCTEAAARAAGKAVVLLGARGYYNKYPVERHYRDIKGLEIYEGTSHIQRLIVGRDLVGPDEGRPAKRPPPPPRQSPDDTLAIMPPLADVRRAKPRPPKPPHTKG